MPETPEPYWDQCQANAKAQGAQVCPQDHCTPENVVGYLHAMCNCEGQFAAYKINGVCPFTYGSAAPVLGTNPPCDCCCGCFAKQTPVAYDKDNYKAIEEFAIGDAVYVADSVALNSWSQKTVKFSSGAGGPQSKNLLIMIAFTKPDGNMDYVFASHDQLFLMSDRKLKTANRLVPGQDEILMYDNSTAKVIALKVGFSDMGLWHIATGLKPASDPAGHLIIVKGLVAGDYSLQITAKTSTPEEANKAGLVEGHETLPVFGTKSYLDTYPHLKGDHHGVEVPLGEMNALADIKAPAHEKHFKHLGKGALRIPEEANYFLSQKQAYELASAPSYPPGSSIHMDLVQYYFQLFKGFFPEVQFYLDHEALLPNAASFKFGDVPFVVINDGLMRLECLEFEMLAFIIAHEIAHLYGGEPQDENGYSCTGQADYAAIMVIMPKVFFGMRAMPVITKAIDQIETLFKTYIPKSGGGTPGDTCKDLPLSCRLRAMKSAAQLGPLPHCAGGPPDPALQVSGASAKAGQEGKAIVTVDFNLAVDPDSATAIGNYEFTPEVDAFSASVNSADNTKVDLTVELTADTKYTVFVSNVMSKNGNPMVQFMNNAEFTYTGE